MVAVGDCSGGDGVAVLTAEPAAVGVGGGGVSGGGGSGGGDECGQLRQGECGTLRQWWW